MCRLRRAIWSHGRFGVDLGLGFSFFKKDNWFKGRAGGYRRTDRYETGAYVTDVDLGNADVFGDKWARNADGSFGAGSFDGPGPVLDLDEATVSHRWGAERSQTTETVEGPFTATPPRISGPASAGSSKGIKVCLRAPVREDLV